MYLELKNKTRIEILQYDINLNNFVINDNGYEIFKTLTDKNLLEVTIYTNEEPVAVFRNKRATGFVFDGEQTIIQLTDISDLESRIISLELSVDDIVMAQLDEL